MSSTLARSSMELMLDALLRKDEQISDSPPALPTRPASMARFPPARRSLTVLTDENTGEAFEGERKEMEESEDSFSESDDNVGFLLIKKGISRNMISQRLTAAAIVIQRHTKGWIAWTLLQRRKKAALCLQHGIRDWLSRRHLYHQNNVQQTCIDDYKDDHHHVQVSKSAMNDLQRQLFKAENELAQKEAEMADLIQQLGRFDNRWLQYYNERMKSLENFWEDQLSSLQISLTAEAKKEGLTSISGNSNGGQFVSFDDDEEEEVEEKLKLKKKNNSVDVQKHGYQQRVKRTTSTRRSHKKWWGLCLFRSCLCLNSRSIDEEEED